MVDIDYEQQLTRIGARVSQQHLISKEQILDRFNKLNKMLENTRDSDIKRLEKLIQLRMAYFNMAFAISEVYGERTLEPDTQFEKREIEQHALAKKREIMETVASLKPISRYHVFNLQRGTQIEEITEKYKGFLRLLKERLDTDMQSGQKDQETFLKLQSQFYQAKFAYEIFNNKENKSQLDERALINFQTDRSDMYVARSFSQIRYVPETFLQNEKGKAPVVLISYNSNGDKITMALTGTLGFGRFRKSNGKLTYMDTNALYEYKIVKQYADPEIAEERRKKVATDNTRQWDEQADSEVFVVYGHLNRNMLIDPETDPQYKKYVIDVYLSNANLEDSLKHNGGYIGEVYLDPQTKEYKVMHDADQLCLAKEFTKAKLSRGEIGIPLSIDLDGKNKDEEKKGEAK